MVAMIWIGVVLSVGGLAGVIWCIRKAMWIKRAKLEDEVARAEIGKLVFVHMAAVGAAFLGLGLMVAGVLLS